MGNTLCKFVKKGLYKDQIDDYCKLVFEAKYVCKKCGRAAKSKKSLCKPKAIKVKKTK